jgi:hypothetical protein
MKCQKVEINNCIFKRYCTSRNLQSVRGFLGPRRVGLQKQMPELFEISDSLLRPIVNGLVRPDFKLLAVFAARHLFVVAVEFLDMVG